MLVFACCATRDKEDSLNPSTDPMTASLLCQLEFVQPEEPVSRRVDERTQDNRDRNGCQKLNRSLRSRL